MKTTGSIIVLLLLCTTGLLAQTFTIRGRVTDKQGKALSGTTVKIMNTQLGTATDVNGKYELKNLKHFRYLIAYNYQGYKTVQKTITLTRDTVLNIKLIALASQMDTIARDKGKQQVAQEATSELEKKEFRNSEGRPRGCIKRLSVSGTAATASPQNYALADSYAPIGFSNAPNYNTEEYGRIIENEFKNAKDNPTSTFSSDVDKASYSNVRRFIMQGAMPPQDAVRVEEMINYFKYDYPEPKDNHPFSITTEVSECPWNTTHRLVHIGLKGKEMVMGNRPKSNLVFLIDVSGSMNESNKLPLVKSSMRLLVSTLNGDDKVSIVVYAGNAGLVLPATSGDHKDLIMDAIDRLEAGGSTAGGQGIELAYGVATENFLKQANNRVILATDGDFNVGVSSDGELTRLIEKKRESGVYLTVLGFGMGNYKDSKMKQLADKGNGNYAYIDNLMEAQKVMVSEVSGTLYTIAKDVKIQVEFNPAIVRSYRLVGYESRLLNREDFNDDKKDAGEVGAGHTVTALYEIETETGKRLETPNNDPLKYQQTNLSQQAASSGELLTVKFRYKLPTSDVSTPITVPLKDNFVSIDKASDNFRFSAAVAGFGMLMSDSKFKGNITYDKVVSLASSALGKDDGGYRNEFVKLVKLAQNIGPYKAAK